MPAKSHRELMAMLERELKFIEEGGYARSGRRSWRPPSFFLDSPLCLNGNPAQPPRPCAECHLMAFVPPQHSHEPIPCHYIPLTPQGDTVHSVEGWADQQELEEKVKQWLKETIQKLAEEANLPPASESPNAKERR